MTTNTEDAPESQRYVPPTVSAFKETVDRYKEEIWCTGTRTGSHTYPSQVLFRDSNYNEYRLVDDQPQRHMGCGCWTGIEFILEPVYDGSLDLDEAARVVDAAFVPLRKANAWAAEHGRPPEWGRDRPRDEKLAAAPLSKLRELGALIASLLEEDVHGLVVPRSSNGGKGD